MIPWSSGCRCPVVIGGKNSTATCDNFKLYKQLCTDALSMISSTVRNGLVMAMCVVPLTTIEPISKVVTSRLETFTNLQEDGSFKDRSGSYDRNLGLALSNGLGNGLGNTWKVNEKTGQIEIFVIDSIRWFEKEI